MVPTRWPVIVAIVIAIVFAIFTVYCCLRCCGCCGLGRRRGGGRRRANTQQPSGFNPLAYQGYAPAGAPAPGYGPEPPRFAQFDNSRKVGEDSLPAMPTWSQGQDKKIMHEGGDVEMGHVDSHQQNGLIHNASTADLGHVPPSHQRGYSEVGNHYNNNNNIPAIKHEPYTGPDFGSVDTSYGGAGGAAHHEAPYTGPDFGQGGAGGNPAPYVPYAPSDVSSTRYEPSHGNMPPPPQAMGTTPYSTAIPPPSPNAQQTGFGGQHAPPGVLQAGRRS